MKISEVKRDIESLKRNYKYVIDDARTKIAIQQASIELYQGFIDNLSTISDKLEKEDDC